MGAPVRAGQVHGQRDALLGGPGGGHGCRASLPANRWQPLGECWIVQNVAVPYSDGKASGTVQLSTPFPAVFSHLCICCKTE